ncbi:MAG: type II toxin-antitoxin system VapC family toxin [Gammaproteobacteria bacterium]|nr:type II toxin-antitoxin system VapC family toxin [Gammaproteobacteria bacterium]
MIVVDTNTIAYLYLPTLYTDDVEKLLLNEPGWAAPVLWRSEFRNVLALYVRKEIIDFETACAIQSQAEQLLASNEYDIDSVSVLALANDSGCSAYDCEFISLAKSLNCKLITSDKKLKATFPEIAMDAGTYISEKF